MGVVSTTKRSATINRPASNETSSEVTAKRTATTAENCDVGLEKRREEVAAKAGRASCVVNRQEARSSLQFECTQLLCLELTGKLGGEPPVVRIFFLHACKLVILEAYPDQEQQ